MSGPLRVLVVEDNPADIDLIREMLSETGPVSFQIESAPRLSRALARLKATELDVVVLDLGLPDSQGLGTFLKLHEELPDVAVVVFTGNDDQEVGVAAVRDGAQDYLVKGKATGDLLVRSLRHAIERKGVDEALRKSEERFRSLYENATIGLYRTTPDGSILLANPALVRMLGYASFDELSVRNLEIDGFEPSYSRRQFLEHVEEEGEVKGLESLWTRRDGTRVLVKESTRAIRDSQGKTLFYDGTVEDITERKRSEEALRESELKYRQVVENASEAVYVVQDGKFVFLNPGTATAFGRSAEDLTGRPFSDLVHPDDRGRVLGYHQARARGEEAPSVHAFRIVREEGDVRWAEVRVVRVDWLGGPASLCLMSDITERKKAEDALWQERTMLARTERIAQVGSWEWAIATDTVTWSDELFRIFQRDPREGAPSFAEHPAFYHPDDMARLQQAVELAVAEGTPYELELRANRKDGKTRACVARGNAEMSPGGRAVRLFGSLQDITEHREAELARERLLRRQVTLNRITLALGTLRELPAILRCLHDETRTLLEADGFFVSRYHKDTQLITALFAVDEGEERDVSTFPPVPLAPEGKGMQSQVLRTGKPLNVPDWLEGEHKMQTVYHIEPDGTFTPPPPDTEREGSTKSALLVPLMFRGEPMGVLQVQSNRPSAYSEEDVGLLAGLANVAAISIQNALLVDEARHAAARIRQGLEGTIQAVALTTEMRDPYTAGHQRRATLLASAIARKIGLSEERMEGLRVAGLLHDVGKISVPAELLSKPGALTPAELSLVKAHPETGYDILKRVVFPWPVADTIREHHERLDGSGYPRGLKGEAIALEAKILAVADVFEAMVSHRPYRPARSLEQALDEITRNAGRLYDQDAVRACVSLFREEGFSFLVAETLAAP